MAGIEKTKASLADLGVVINDAISVAEGGLTLGDLLALPHVIGGLTTLFADAKAAVDGGELADLDASEVVELLKDVIAMGADLMGKLKAPAAA